MPKLLQIAFGVLMSGKAFDPAVCMAAEQKKKEPGKERKLALTA